MKIITLTLNPAEDLHIYADGQSKGEKVTSRHSGGKGVNLSRALHAYGVEHLTALAVGEDGSPEFLKSLYDFGLSVFSVEAKGNIRVNKNIHTRNGEIVENGGGVTVDKEAVAEFEKAFLPLANGDEYFAFSGSISPTSDKDAVFRFLLKLRDKGVKLILDSRSLSLEEIIFLHPHLIKPNQTEAENLTGLKITDINSAKSAALALSLMGVENVLLTLGEDGAILASGDVVYHAEVPKITPISTVGAGDSTIAGYLAARKGGLSAPETLRLAAAFGTAASLTEGSLPPLPGMIEEVLEETTVREI